LGHAYWANRLQDWRLRGGRIESVAEDPDRLLSTVALLTRSIEPAAGAAYVSARVRKLAGGEGFCGFLVGGGAGNLDWRSAALVQQANGVGGGILCVIETNGRLAFRDHTDEGDPLSYSTLAASSGAVAPELNELELRLAIEPESAGRVRLTLSALDGEGAELATVSLGGQAQETAAGGVMLTASTSRASSSPRPRFSFDAIRTAGPGVKRSPERTFGPILGSMYTLAGGVLKLSAQLAPVGPSESQMVTLEIREGASWRSMAEAHLGAGHLATFRVPDWDSSRERQYRITWSDSIWEGTVRREPDAAQPLTLGLINCVAPVSRNLDQGGPPIPLPSGSIPGRYSPQCIAFPFRSLVENLAKHKPDLLVFAGDQFYEGRPTRADSSSSPTLDYLYKWSMWHWSFRELTRSIPALVQIDDHDVYQGNIWGQGGRPAPEGDQNRGGYVRDAAWVNMVHQTQCAHNPDPFDPTPIGQGIHVYYASFRYGGASFALLEDRKFKTGRIVDPGFDMEQAQLLGARQERFLEAWAKDKESAGDPRICFTQTTFACVHTEPDGSPAKDMDSNGYPKNGRDRALRLIRDAGAVMLSGDQHLAHVVRHGLESHTDGPVQFTAPAGSSLFTRWFEPNHLLANSSGTHTGDFNDAFENQYRVLAVANPLISHAAYFEHRSRGKGLEDPNLRTDGYGIVRVDKQQKVFILECWPSGTSSRFPPNRQFAGWPIRLPFDQVRGEGG
jgi:alkaline phosphatase D